MRKPTKEIQLTSYDDLLGIENLSEDSKDKIVEVPLSELYSFQNHPFHVKDDEKMEETVVSIHDYGVLNPGLVRPRTDGGYEVVAGHRRKRASELAGKATMPVIVREYTDDEAVVIMVDSNIQRENILPSEKAYAYKMKLAALKHQGIRSTQDEDTADVVGKEIGDSGRTVQRYIRLTELLSELLEMVDTGVIKFTPAVALSYLSKEEQQWILKCVKENGGSVSNARAAKLKKHSEDGGLTELAVELILCEDKPEPVKVILPENKIKQFFPAEYSKQQMEQVILELLERWNQGQ